MTTIDAMIEVDINTDINNENNNSLSVNNVININNKEEGSPTCTPVIVNNRNKTLLFDGCIFSLEHDVCSGKREEKKQLVETIKNHGGKIHYLLTKDVTFLLVNDSTPDDGSALATYKQKLAAQHEIPIVKPSFLQECIEANMTPEDMLSLRQPPSYVRRKKNKKSRAEEDTRSSYKRRRVSKDTIATPKCSLYDYILGDTVADDDSEDTIEDESAFEYRGAAIDESSFTTVNDVMLVKDFIVEFEFDVATIENNTAADHSNSEKKHKSIYNGSRVYRIKKTSVAEKNASISMFTNLKAAEVLYRPLSNIINY